MKNEIGFLLSGIVTEQFATFDDSFKKDEPVELSTGLKFGVDDENQTISVTVSIQFMQNKNPFLKLDAACHFQIIDSAWKKFISKDKIIIPQYLITHLAVLAVGTTRGVLHAKTENTPFNSFMLPTINVKEMIDEDLVIEIEK